MVANLKYIVLLKVVNKAGLYSVAPSPIIMLDKVRPEIGTVRPGQDFRIGHRYQRESDTMYGSVTAVYTKEQLLCDEYDRISFLGPVTSVSIFTELTRYCFDSMCTDTIPGTQQLGDGVTFAPSQATQASDGYRLFMIFPQPVRATSGAIYTTLTATLNGQYEFDMQVSCVEELVSSVFWWGGDMVNFVNPQYGIDPNNPSEANSEKVVYFQPLMSYTEEGTVNKTILQVAAFGLMFIKAGPAMHDWKIYIWSSNYGGQPNFVVFSLNRPPSG